MGISIYILVAIMAVNMGLVSTGVVVLLGIIGFLIGWMGGSN